MNDSTQGRASILLSIPDSNGQYTHEELGRGLSFGEAERIVLRLLGDRQFEHSVYMGDYYFFGEPIRVGKDRFYSYYYVFDPHPEIGEGGKHWTPAPERWLSDKAVQS
jgi:hypothetical protein